jgi:membrane-associated phospholipid phosphatase
MKQTLLTILSQKYRLSKILLPWILVSLSIPGFVGAEEKQPTEATWKRGKNAIVADYKSFYSLNGLGQLTAGLGVAGMLANTDGDREIQEWYQDSIRSGDTDNFAKVAKTFGGGRITIPFFMGTALLGELSKDTNVGSLAGEWATRSLRTILVGAPPLLFLQKALGASRPSKGNSQWHLFEDSNGVSGHSFMGAVPFLSAAKMTKNPYFKTVLYLGSTVCGISRINDDKHYFSQVALGWWLAYLSAKSVDQTEHRAKKVRMMPDVSDGRIGIRVNVAF